MDGPLYWSKASWSKKVPVNVPPVENTRDPAHHRTPSINAQCRSMPIKILALIRNTSQCQLLPINADQWSVKWYAVLALHLFGITHFTWVWSKNMWLWQPLIKINRWRCLYYRLIYLPSLPSDWSSWAAAKSYKAPLVVTNKHTTITGVSLILLIISLRKYVNYLIEIMQICTYE